MNAEDSRSGVVDEAGMVDYFALIHKYIAPTSQAYRIYLPHAVQVTHKALALARKIDLGAEEMRFIEEAAMLHDIGIVAISAPEIGCTGDLPYICHGTEGRKMLEAEGLPRHALVCERHLGVGLSLAEIVANRMPLPHREMIPESPEEE